MNRRRRARRFIVSEKDLLGRQPAGEIEMITIIARCTAQPDKVEDLVTMALDLVAASRSETGNVAYDFHQDLEDPTRFAFVEIWRDQEAIETHGATPHFQGFMERAGPCFAAPLEIALYRRLD
jgi:quinol monooxygenase YgiN